MSSPTQRRLDPVQVTQLARASFGPATTVADCAELAGGGFAAVWRVRLDDGRQVVLKAGPPADVRLLRYEHELIAAEARYFRLVGPTGVPVPEVLHHGTDRRILDNDWLFTSLLPGRALPGWPQIHPGVDDGPVRRQSGAAMARVHTITGSRFGYPGRRPYGDSWAIVFTALVDDLLADADEWQVTLPVPGERIRAVVARHVAELASVTRPVLLHFDLWDGNVLGTVDPAGTRGSPDAGGVLGTGGSPDARSMLDAGGACRLTGLVDGERHLFGDPLMDFVSPVLFRRVEDESNHPFVCGYTETTGRPLRLNGAARRRLALYRLHLYLLMIVEMPSRGITDAADRPRYDFLARLLDEEFTHLTRARTGLPQQLTRGTR